jgi:hypothetical protein
LSTVDDFLRIAGHVANNKIQLRNTKFEGHGKRHTV